MIVKQLNLFGPPTLIETDVMVENRKAKETVQKHVKPPLVLRHMTEREKYVVGILSLCTFAPGTWDKRFVKGMKTLVEINGKVTESQIYHLWRTVYRYRRQIKVTSLIEEAERCIDFVNFLGKI